MFGREVKLPVDVMFGRPNVNFSHSSEYIKELHSVLESSFKLAREVTQRKQERQNWLERFLKGNRNDRKTIMMYDPLMEGTK